MKIGICAPASRLESQIAERVAKLAATRSGGLELRFHPQCFLCDGHFAGSDAARADAFVELANDPALDALWIGRGGYGANRLLPIVVSRLTPGARDKLYMGYSDAGFLLAALDGLRFPYVAHGPMPADILRDDGDKAVLRALSYFLDRHPSTVEPRVAAGTPSVAFNLTVLSHLIGTPWQPDVTDRVLMIEDVSEHMYRVDRALFHVTSNPEIREAAGLRLGRIGAVPPNEPEFGRSQEEVAAHWCKISGIPYLGRADIGHDADNKIVPFGR